ncbi:DUF3298 and DUF4163 domain-containing protein [Xanthomonas hortorum]|uniref:Deacetylase PdaC domain-containing protein n=1 Tax=Xanthomonas hortorum pv. gardneri TaxID=2754056 RepID=A0A6V7DYT7_9XANT|nr:DUF3298 and DUF4163 domain-containing protein [Xanthomonas hortorum]APP80098.1 hypothetical protein BJD10_10620 [Xanthomonas hortorum pv. gardneri]EGD18783.1 hypothetical protein XGA_2600 [Xanthomonas hortorum ATCC 19865]MCC8497345.1 DUF3298 and DUF4163 domain-containing protein [Xanthomonas hortorum pv. gardneri]MCC8506104.1 DUF3298 and DUF4163 domain-containing protein [Xanthomonas hortorum pv. gardneri]MCC8513690.1 DUF3298 and DUF4163 domain-containing protein [Xanthomonas hortorum pv. g
MGRLFAVNGMRGVLMLALLAGCTQRAPTTAETTEPAADATAQAMPPPEPVVVQSGPLEDVIEHAPAYMVGISYPRGLDAYPELAALIRSHSQDARTELMEAVAGLGNDKPAAPYELSLAFETVLQTADLIVVSADGSRYTGGAHGEPLVARFVWLVKERKQLTAQALIPDPAGWEKIAREVAAQLHNAAAQRVEADRVPVEDQAEQVASADRMIAEGTAAQVDNFAQFVPVLNPAGQIAALRFVFPPYQVGPYSDGTQIAQVSAATLLPWIAPEYVHLFAR